MMNETETNNGNGTTRDTKKINLKCRYTVDGSMFDFHFISPSHLKVNKCNFVFF